MRSTNVFWHYMEISMCSELTIAFIGPGVMAEAMLSGLLKKKLIPADRIVISGPFEDQNDALKKKYGVKPFTDNSLAVKNADIVILSIKPQSLKKVLEGLRGAIKPDALVLSIVAGASIAKISRLLGHTVIVRSMPNTPAQIGEGITVWTCSPAVTDTQ